MRRLFIFSSDARGRRWGLFALLLLAILGSLELALRFPQMRRLLPPRTHYYHPAIAQRIDELERVKRVYGRVDVLFIGSSIVLTNVHPLLFDSIAGRDPGHVVSFNVGLSGLWPTSVHLYAQHLWLPLTRPRVVVQGVRYAELAATTHAKNETQVWSGRIEPAWRDAGLMTRAYAATVSRLFLLQYHGALTRALQRFRSGWIGPIDPEEDDEHAVRGYHPRGAPEGGSVDEWENDLPNDGTCADGGCKVGFAALRRTIAAVRSGGGTYVLMNVPEHPARWREAEAVQRYQSYVGALREFAEAEGVVFVDPTDGDPFRFAGIPYNDLSHMTAAGARQFTRALADRMTPILETALPLRRELHASTRRGFGRLLYPQVLLDVAVPADAPDLRVEIVVLQGEADDSGGKQLFAETERRRILDARHHRE
jgi:hypothetical protein